MTTRIEKRTLTDNPYWRDCTDEELRFQISGLEEREGISIDRLHGRQSLLEQLNEQLRRTDAERFPEAWMRFVSEHWVWSALLRLVKL
ncbi:MAG: hypothetical protein U0930_20795 [Pirellulales bacterium]